MQKRSLLFAAVFFFSVFANAQTDKPSAPIDSLANDRSFILTDPLEVLKHEDELITVEGCVVRATLKEQIKGKPIFLDIFAPYPQNVLTVVIWEDDQAQFLSAEHYQQKMIRVSGKAKKKTYTNPGNGPKERISISLKNPKQITILGDCPAEKK